MLRLRVGVLALFVAFIAGCADASLEETASDTSAIEGPSYVGDQGGGDSAEEMRFGTDPTKEAGFAIDQSAVADAPEKLTLKFTWQGQPNGFWCGPGSTRMALSTQMAAPPTQDVIAKQLGTTTDGTARIDTIRVLNDYLVPRTPYISVPVDGRPTQEQRDLLKWTILYRLGSGYPVIANVLSGWRPPGYPTGTIGHFVAVVGYDQRGDKVLISDPAGEGSAGPRWKNVPRTYWITTENLGTWVGGRGYSH